jgi:hypothetical protein
MESALRRDYSGRQNRGIMTGHRSHTLALAATLDGLLAELPESADEADSRLSPQFTKHRDHPREGCPLAALGSELARVDVETRKGRDRRSRFCRD